jgi:hypothetical protein
MFLNTNIIINIIFYRNSYFVFNRFIRNKNPFIKKIFAKDIPFFHSYKRYILFFLLQVFLTKYQRVSLHGSIKYKNILTKYWSNS